MKSVFAARMGRGMRLAGLAGAVLALAPIGFAQSLSFSTPLGSVTVFGSGDQATYLRTSAMLGGVDAADSLNYLDAGNSPAVSRSEAIASDGSFAATASLGIDESQTTGLPFTSGSIGFSSSGAGAGTGSGTIKVFLLIDVPTPVMIDLSGIRSAVTTTGSPGDAFSLGLFRSDATGAAIGGALYSFSGNLFDQGASYQSSQQYYVLEMTAAANATPASVDAVNFSFALNLTTVAPVPEPASIWLGVLALCALAAHNFRRGARLRRLQSGTKMSRH